MWWNHNFNKPSSYEWFLCFVSFRSLKFFLVYKFKKKCLQHIRDCNQQLSLVGYLDEDNNGKLEPSLNALAMVNIHSFVIHQKYNPNETDPNSLYDYDIAIVRTKEDMHTKVYINFEYFPRNVYENMKVRLFGYGRTETNRYADDLFSMNAIVRVKEPRPKYCQLRGIIMNRIICIQENQFNDDGQSTKSDIGDSGGPIIDAKKYDEHGLFYFVGIKGLNVPNSIYKYATNVEHFREWIFYVRDNVGIPEKISDEAILITCCSDLDN